MNKIAGVEMSPFDQRDIPYIPKILPEDLPESVDLRPNIFEVENQYSEGSCVANGVLASAEYLYKKAGLEVDDLSRMFNYVTTLDYEKRLGGYGVHSRNAYKMLAHYGVPLEEDYPYDKGNDDLPPMDIYSLARDRKALRYESVVRNERDLGGAEKMRRINTLKSCLAEGLPVGFRMDISDSIYGLTGPWQTHRYQGVTIDTPSIGGHFMLAVGYDKDQILVLNSWGTSYGDGGYIGIPAWEVTKSRFEGWCLRNFAGIEVPEPEGVRVEEKTRYTLKARLVVPQEDVGKDVSVWLGAISAGGVAFLANDMGEWGAVLDDYKPTYDSYKLNHDNPITFVEWMDMAPFEGATFYLAYGDSPLDWKIHKVCEI